jgi:hypothetical protein
MPKLAVRNKFRVDDNLYATVPTFTQASLLNRIRSEIRRTAWLRRRHYADVVHVAD